MIGLREDHSSTPVPASRAPELTAKIFAEDGWLHDGFKLEHRPQQESMARAIAAALKSDEPLLFEAGTGVGKSLAYLTPGIIHAVDQERQLIVSTHTISLQEQLETKDLPLVRRLFKTQPDLARYVDFRSAVLLGKSNYLCTTRLAQALVDRATLFTDADYDELQRLAAWAETSETGLRHDLRPPPRAEIWDAVNADSSSCSRKHCDHEKCFYQRARARIRLRSRHHYQPRATLRLDQRWRRESERHDGRRSGGFVSRRFPGVRRGSHGPRSRDRQLRPRTQQL